MKKKNISLKIYILLELPETLIVTLFSKEDRELEATNTVAHSNLVQCIMKTYKLT